MNKKKTVWVVWDRDQKTPIAGVWSNEEDAVEHCPKGYVVVELELDIDYTKMKGSWEVRC